MRTRILTSYFFSVALAAGLAVGCKEAKQSVKSDPHSPEAAMRAIREQGDLLNDAMKRKDFQFIHDNMYYLQSLAKALYGKLEAEQKERLKARFDELAKVTDELDHAAGRRHEEATQTTMKRLLELLKDLDGEFRTEKSTRTIPQR